MKIKKYKNSRKYRCPYCDKIMTRNKLINHITDCHESMIPEGYNATRVVYDYINKKDHGTCMVCGTNVYEWDDNICRYKNICNNPKCRETLIKKAEKNNLNDPEKQKLMLSHRHLSGEYKFSDGTVHTYVGSYERKTLEFMDVILHIKGTDIMTPGPIVKYNYNGEEHCWILDIFYIPAMLAIDCKDGGSNPNTRPMQSYREKQIAKETAIAKQKKYNYLRLTDNDFTQLLYALADIKFGIIEKDTNKGIYINESATANVMAPTTVNKNYYVIQEPLNQVFSGNDTDNYDYIFTNTVYGDGFKFDSNDNIEKVDKETIKKEFYNENNNIFCFSISDDNINISSKNSLLESLLGFKYRNHMDMYYSENCLEFDLNKIDMDQYVSKNSIYKKIKESVVDINVDKVIDSKYGINIIKNPISETYYLENEKGLIGKEYKSLKDITINEIYLFKKSANSINNIFDLL